MTISAELPVLAAAAQAVSELTAPVKEGVLLVGDAVGRGGAGSGASPGFGGIADGIATDTVGFPITLALGFAGLLGVAAFMGATRFMSREQVLANDVRRRIYEYVRANVGTNLKQVTDALGLTTTNAIWHLRKLEDASLVHSRRFNGFKIFYPAEGGVQARRMSLSLTALANANALQVFSFVVANPGAHQREIARALGVNHGTVRWHLKKLRAAEILTEEKRGKASAYFATDLGLETLNQLSDDPAPTATPGALAAAN